MSTYDACFSTPSCIVFYLAHFGDIGQRQIKCDDPCPSCASESRDVYSLRAEHSHFFSEKQMKCLSVRLFSCVQWKWQSAVLGICFLLFLPSSKHLVSVVLEDLILISTHAILRYHLICCTTVFFLTFGCVS